jgi:hypothetical protein
MRFSYRLVLLLAILSISSVAPAASQPTNSRTDWGGPEPEFDDDDDPDRVLKKHATQKDPTQHPSSGVLDRLETQAVKLSAALHRVKKGEGVEDEDVKLRTLLRIRDLLSQMSEERNIHCKPILSDLVRLEEEREKLMGHAEGIGIPPEYLHEGTQDRGRTDPAAKVAQSLQENFDRTMIVNRRCDDLEIIFGKITHRLDKQFAPFIQSGKHVPREGEPMPSSSAASGTRQQPERKTGDL